MATAKVVYDGETLIDLTADTVAANNMLAGVTAHGADGEPIVGLGDEHLLSRNIKKDVTIFGVTGTHEGGGGSEAAIKDINFYDFDGTRLYSYWLSELPLAAFPAAPDHSEDEVPLTFQEWTHTLEQVNACTSKLDVGATLIPTDGKTHLIINIVTGGRMTVPLYFAQGVANGVSIDWGDGSIAQTVDGTGYVSTTHTYAAIGRYDVTLTVADGGWLTLGRGVMSACMFGKYGVGNQVYCDMLQELYIGNNMATISTSMCYYCTSLTKITIPHSVINIIQYAFRYCYSLVYVVIPASVTEIEGNILEYCYSLKSAVIPQTVTRILGDVFGGCYGLKSIVIPNSVKTIMGGVFGDCYGLNSIVIPNSVTYMDSGVFSCCISLSSVVLSQNASTIGTNTFSKCSSLAYFILPQSVTLIKPGAFYWCYGMAIYDFSACTAVPTLEATSAFTSIPSDCIMKIPAALFDEWSTATNWSTYADKMVAV